MGSVTGKALIKNGIQIKGYIDRRAEEIRECIGIPVYSISELKKTTNAEAVIFVAVKNVYYHMEIASTLYDCGFRKIIYKTAHAINGCMSSEEKILDMAYESIYKTGDIPAFDIPVIEPEQELEWQDNRIIWESGDYVTVNVPLEQIYTGITTEQWADVPVLSLIPHIRMFQYFEGKRKEKPEDYVKLCEEGARNENIEITESWKQYVLQNRFNIYEQMRWRYENEPDFFVEQAPAVTWNEKGYFNLRTGKHRICFLAAMDRTSVPVKMEKKVWTELCEDKKIRQIRQILEKKPNLKIPLPHFYFQGNIQYHCILHQRKLRNVYAQMYDENIMRGKDRKTYEVYDLTQDSGYFAVIFSQMGFRVFKDCNLSKEENEIYAHLGMMAYDRLEMSEKQVYCLLDED